MRAFLYAAEKAFWLSLIVALCLLLALATLFVVLRVTISPVLHKTWYITVTFLVILYHNYRRKTTIILSYARGSLCSTYNQSWGSHCQPKIPSPKFHFSVCLCVPVLAPTVTGWVTGEADSVWKFSMWGFIRKNSWDHQLWKGREGSRIGQRKILHYNVFSVKVLYNSRVMMLASPIRDVPSWVEGTIPLCTLFYQSLDASYL